MASGWCWRKRSYETADFALTAAPAGAGGAAPPAAPQLSHLSAGCGAVCLWRGIWGPGGLTAEYPAADGKRFRTPGQHTGGGFGTGGDLSPAGRPHGPPHGWAGQLDDIGAGLSDGLSPGRGGAGGRRSPGGGVVPVDPVRGTVPGDGIGVDGWLWRNLVGTGL